MFLKIVTFCWISSSNIFLNGKYIFTLKKKILSDLTFRQVTICSCLGKYFNEACVVPDKKLKFHKDFLCFYMAWLHVITKSITYKESEILSKPHFKFEREHSHFI